MIGTTMLNGNKKTRNLLGLLVIWVGLVLGPTQIIGFGQTSGPATNIRVFASDPTGNACSQTSVGLYGGALFTCQSGVYASIGGGGSFSTPVIITSSANPCFAVGPNGATNPTFAVDCSPASAATGIKITPAAAGSGVTIGVTSSGSNENLVLAVKGTGTLNLLNNANPIIVSDSSTVGILTVFGGNGNGVRLANGGVHLGSVASVSWGTGGPVAQVLDTGLVRFAPGVIRATNASTGAGQLLIGTSTDTADAQLSVYSQSTTRPGLKLRALAGTADTQPIFETYNAAGTRNFYIQSDGQFSALLVNGAITTVGAGSAVIIGQNASLLGEAAHVLAQRNGTNAQTFRVYETYTDGSNYERLEINASATTNTIKPAAAGTGTASKIDYYLTPTVFMTSGTGSPEGAVTAGIGSTYHRTDGGAGTSFYVKESGTGNTGWIAK